MTAAKIKSVEVKGFRAFGEVPQTLVFDSSVAVLWGPNSQGKTSFAEALEFLFTGTIARRDLLASSKDEFADSLRNVHLDPKSEVYVEAVIVHGDDTHSVRRTLTADFAKKGGCESCLKLDGADAAEGDLARVGLALSQPPLAAPILMQHTLPHVFSMGPQGRATYFKALLELGDLDAFLEAARSSSTVIAKPQLAVLGKLAECASMEPMQEALAPLLRGSASSTAVADALLSAARNTLRESELPTPNTANETFKALSACLSQKRSETFPLDELGAGSVAPLRALTTDIEAAVISLEEQRTKLNEETQRLLPFLQAALRVPEISGLQNPEPCPLCKDGTLHPDRVEAIRSHLRDTEAFRGAEASARQALHSLATLVSGTRPDIDRALPRFIGQKSQERKRRGFDVARARRLIGEDGGQSVTAWLCSTKVLLKSRRELNHSVGEVSRVLSDAASNIETLDARVLQRIKAGVLKLTATHTEFIEALEAYRTDESALLIVLPAAVERESKTEGWQQLLDLRDQTDALAAAIAERARWQTLQGELEAATKAIQQGIGRVLDQKISEISGDVQKWWAALRPGEPTFFSSVERRKKAARTIDFKAGLSPSEDGTNPETRDAVAVLSYSQLQCLGLSVFLARVTREQSGFVVLDDPVVAGDDDHRPHFVHSVIPELLDAGVQVIVMTQDQAILSDMSNLFEYLKIDCFQILRDPATGAAVNKTSDGLAAILARVQPFLGNSHPEARKNAAQITRDAAERLCKEILVKDKRANGDSSALVSDYQETLGGLVPKVIPLLKKPDEPGKLRSIGKNMNPGNHDGTIPNSSDIKVAIGYLKKFKKDYL